MKKLIFLSALISSALFSNAQSVADGLNLTQSDTYGSARFRSMSGAFGALGGDLSAIGINPAGSVIFNNHYGSFTLGVLGNNNDTQFNSTNDSENDTSFTLSQAGGVLIFKSNNEEQLINKFSFGLNYDQTRSYDNAVDYSGNSATGLADYFLDFANGISIDNFQLRSNESVSDLYQFLGENVGFDAQQGFLAFESFLIDGVDNTDPNNTAYISNTGVGNFNQRYLIDTDGYQSKLSFNGALQLDSKWSLGLNINTHFSNIERRIRFSETNNNGGTVEQVEFNDELITEAAGVSFQIGAIGNLTKSLRVGASYQTPTWYEVDESSAQSIATVRDDNGSRLTAIVAPDVVNIFRPYDLRSPGKVTGSLAYIFGKTALISVDYSVRNWGNLEFDDNDGDLFANNNRIIDDNLQNAASLRIGGEYRIKNWSIRAGYRYDESPYEDDNIMSELIGYSVGLGYAWNNTHLDLSYDRFERDMNRELFTGTGNVNNTANNVLLTLGFDF